MGTRRESTAALTLFLLVLLTCDYGITIVTGQGDSLKPLDDKMAASDGSHNSKQDSRHKVKRSPNATYRQRLLALLNSGKRANWQEMLCGQWDEWCSPSSDNPSLLCCDQYVCKCNLWNTNCRCGSRLFNRRWN